MINNGQTSRAVAWSPAKVRMPAPYKTLSGPSLGQGDSFFSSPLVNFGFDLWTAAIATYLGWGLSKRGNDGSTFWYVVGALSGFKALYDLSKIDSRS